MIAAAVALINIVLYLIQGEISFYGVLLITAYALYGVCIFFVESAYDLQNTDQNSITENGILGGGYNPFSSLNWMMLSMYALAECVFMALYQGGGGATSANSAWDYYAQSGCCSLSFTESLHEKIQPSKVDKDWVFEKLSLFYSALRCRNIHFSQRFYFLWNESL